jgi:broad specificity phosphatase PhoE
MANMVLFIRHGQSEANRKDVFAGSRDNSPLTEKGQQESLSAAQTIKAQYVPINKIITSPLRRAIDTARIIAEQLQYDASYIIVDERLKEYDMGVLSGKAKKDIRAIDYIMAEGAEDVHAFQARIMSVVSEARSFPGTVLLVSHSGVGRMISATNSTMPIEQFYDIPSYANATVVELT